MLIKMDSHFLSEFHQNLWRAHVDTSLFQNSDNTTRLASELVPLEILVVSTRFNSRSLAEISPSVYTASTVHWTSWHLPRIFQFFMGHHKYLSGKNNGKIIVKYKCNEMVFFFKFHFNFFSEKKWQKSGISMANVPMKPPLKLRVSHCSLYGRHCVNTGWYLGQTPWGKCCPYYKDFQRN